ncbi:MAG: ArsB/NhaD family transporter [Bdellovibrionales bacterium]|nr:ArsB/NhaD family transporter [Bdellovibrionales bacterium]
MLVQAFVVAVFISIFVGIVLDKVDKTLLAASGAVILILSGVLSFESAIHSIDFDTLALLLGMMVFVEGLTAVGIFKWLSLKLGLITRGNPLYIFLLINIATAFLSAFLDNVTTVLILAPLMISLTQGIGLPPKIFLLSVIFMSNIGGAATMIGDPPNILIGSQVEHLGFVDFLEYMTAPVLLSILVVIGYLKLTKGDLIRSRDDMLSWLFASNLMLADIRHQARTFELKRSVKHKSLFVFIAVIAGFLLHPVTHIEPPVVAITGAVFLLLVFHKQINLHHLFGKIEWHTLLFFAGLFIVVGALEEVGVLETISHLLVSLTSNTLVLILIILWASAILSALVDNIPFVAVMIPVLSDLIHQEPFASNPKSHLLWWALALGACFGGNGSIIGASANVVSVGIAQSKGIKISFMEFAKEAVPVTFLTILVSTLYLTFLYFM